LNYPILKLPVAVTNPSFLKYADKSGGSIYTFAKASSTYFLLAAIRSLDGDALRINEPVIVLPLLRTREFSTWSTYYRFTKCVLNSGPKFHEIGPVIVPPDRFNLVAFCVSTYDFVVNWVGSVTLTFAADIYPIFPSTYIGIAWLSAVALAAEYNSIYLSEIPGAKPPLIWRLPFAANALKFVIPVPGLTWPDVRYTYEVPYETDTVLCTFLAASSTPVTYNPWVFRDPSLDSGFDPYVLIDERSDYNCNLSVLTKPKGVVAYPTGY